MRGCHRFLTILGFQLRRKKALRLFPWRFYSQNVLSGLEGSDTGFNPTKRALDRADREFELLGPEATFQGSALKLEDAPKLKLPEVMSNFVYTDTAYYWLPLQVYPPGQSRGYLREYGGIGCVFVRCKGGEGLHKIVSLGEYH